MAYSELCALTLWWHTVLTAPYYSIIAAPYAASTGQLLLQFDCYQAFISKVVQCCWWLILMNCTTKFINLIKNMISETCSNILQILLLPSTWLLLEHSLHLEALSFHWLWGSSWWQISDLAQMFNLLFACTLKINFIWWGSLPYSCRRFLLILVVAKFIIWGC